MNSKLIFSLFSLTVLAITHQPASAIGDETDSAAVDWVEIAYKKTEILRGHASPEETLALIKQLIDLGQLQPAREILSKSPSFPNKYRAQHLDTVLRLQCAEYFGLGEQDPIKELQKSEVRKILLQLAQETQLDLDALTRYTQLAEEFAVGTAVVAFCGRLAEADSANRSQWWAKAGEWCMADHQPQEAVLYYQKAYAGTRSDLDRNRYFIARLRALQAAGQHEKIAAAIKALLESKGDDDKIFSELAQISLQIKRPDLAWRLYGHLAMADPMHESHWQAETTRWALAANQPLEAAAFLHNLPAATLTLPKQEELLRHQITLLLRGNQPEKALDVSRKLFLLKPTDLLVEQQLAQLEEWTGNKRVALSHWQHLCTVEDQLGFHEQVYRLSRMLNEHRPALEALIRIAALRQLTGKEQEERVFLHEWLGEIENAAQEATAYLAKYPVQRCDEKQFSTIEHFLYLQQQSGRQQDALQFALHSAEETHEQRFLLLALKIAAASHDEETVDALLQQMAATPRSFATEPYYWLIQAERKYGQGDYQAASDLYQRALACDPDSLTAREGILWSLLCLSDTKNLTAQLESWQPQALKHRELWLVYALSRQSLGHYPQAATWYERLIDSGHTDYGIILGYADVLEATGRADRAYQLRMWTMGQLHTEAATFLQQQGKLTETIKSYVALMHRYGSTQQGEYWLQLLQQSDKDTAATPWIYELAISWYLNRQLPDQAKVWLAKAHEQRISIPKWQETLLAPPANTPQQLPLLLAQTSGHELDSNVAIENHRDLLPKARRLVETSNSPGQGEAQRDTDSRQRNRTTYWRMGFDSFFSDLLDSNEAYLTGRYSPPDTPLSYGASYRFADYSSDVYRLDDHDSAHDLSLIAYLGDDRHGGCAAIGLNHHDADDIGYGYFDYRRQLSSAFITQLKVAFHTIPEVDSILQVATVQNRADAVLSGAVARNYYYYFDLWARKYTTRDNDDVATGSGATAEIGFKQLWSRMEWLTGVQVNFEDNSDRELPEELREILPEGSTVDDVVAEKATTLLVGGRIGHGEIREESPSTTSLRYFASAWLGPNWPQEELTINLRAGTGVKLFSNDELSFQAHYNQAGGVVGRNDDSGISLQYRYVF